MRRAVRALLVGGVLLSAAAGCGTAKSSPKAAPAPGASAADPAQAATRSACEALGQVYTQKMAPFAEAVTNMVPGGKTAGKAGQQQAQEKLRDFGTAIQSATEASTDAKIRTDGKQAATVLQKKASDAAFFGKIKTTNDVNTLLGPTLKQWLSPVTSHCS